MTQQQFTKNPNSGYLKPSDFGEGKFTGVVEITPQLIAELNTLAQTNGTSFVRLNVSEAKQGKFGVYERATMKVLTQEQVSRHQGAKTQAQPAAAPIQQQPPQYNQAPVQPQQAPVHQQPVQAAPQPQAPNPVVDPLEDEIPF